MRTRARSPRRPRELNRGSKVMDGISGEELFMYDSTTRYQRHMWVHKDNYDALLDEDREYNNGRLANKDQWTDLRQGAILVTEDDVEIITEDGENIEIEE